MAAWSQLAPEILGCILQRLPLLDHLSFGCVCTTWHSTVSSRLHRPAPQSPWLMLPTSGGEDPNYAHFYSLSDDVHRRRRIGIRQPDPPIRTRAWIGSSSDGGWLVTADETSELHLLNPFTGTQIPLPSVTTFPFVQAAGDKPVGRRVGSYRLIRDDGPPETIPAFTLRFHLFVKAIVHWWNTPSTTAATSSSSSAPTSTGGEYTVVLIYGPHNMLAFARAGDATWTTVDLPYAYGFTDVIIHRGWLHTVDGSGLVGLWDLSKMSSTPSFTWARPDVFADAEYTAETKYLVKSAAKGELLQVWRAGVWGQWQRRGGAQRTVMFKVFKMEMCEGKYRKWVEVDDLGGEALFLGRGHSAAVAGGSLGVEGNCIYFTDDYWGNPEVYRRESRDTGVFRMADKRIDYIFPVNFPSRWPPPIWITPSLE